MEFREATAWMEDEDVLKKYPMLRALAEELRAIWRNEGIDPDHFPSVDADVQGQGLPCLTSSCGGSCIWAIQ